MRATRLGAQARALGRLFASSAAGAAVDAPAARPVGLQGEPLGQNSFLAVAGAVLAAFGAVYQHIDAKFDKLDGKFDALTAELRGLRDKVSTTSGATGVLATDVGILVGGKVKEQQQAQQQQQQQAAQQQQPAPAPGDA